MSENYDVPQLAARASWIDQTGQTEYTATWDRQSVWLSGTNLNDGTEWSSPQPVEEPERFGPFATLDEFFAWVARFVTGGAPVTRVGIEHRHEYRGQALVHTHPHDGPHGYFEHPEDAHWGSLAPGYSTDTPYTDLSR